MKVRTRVLQGLCAFALTCGLSGCGELVLAALPAGALRALPEPMVAALGCPVDAPQGDFEQRFSWAERCGAILGVDAWFVRGQGLSDVEARDFYNGVGHGLQAPPEDLDAWLIRAQSLPAEHRAAAHETVVQAYTRASSGEAAEVVPWAESYAARAGISVPYDGVRVGLQEGHGEELFAAVQLAGAYPQAWHTPLYEELGWRLGDRQLRGGEVLGEVLPGVPEGARCAFVQGAARGLAMRLLSSDHERGGEGGSWTDVQQLIDGGGEACYVAGWGGVGWAAVITVGRDSLAVDRALAGVNDVKGRRIAQDAARFAREGGHPPWTLPGGDGEAKRGRPLPAGSGPGPGQQGGAAGQQGGERGPVNPPR